MTSDTAFEAKQGPAVSLITYRAFPVHTFVVRHRSLRKAKRKPDGVTVLVPVVRRDDCKQGARARYAQCFVSCRGTRAPQICHNDYGESIDHVRAVSPKLVVILIQFYSRDASFQSVPPVPVAAALEQSPTEYHRYDPSGMDSPNPTTVPTRFSCASDTPPSGAVYCLYHPPRRPWPRVASANQRFPNAHSGWLRTVE